MRDKKCQRLYKEMPLLLCCVVISYCSISEAQTTAVHNQQQHQQQQLPRQQQQLQQQLPQQHQQQQQQQQPQQSFRVRPANLSVVQGKTAVLSCEIDHQTGRLQWTRQGFALGYLRHLPGYPRYRMVGDATAGVNHLQISNVSLLDDGRFQCQVAPNRGQMAIKAAAYLTVLVTPSDVRITSPSRLVADQTYEMNVGSQLLLECHVTAARPAAQVVWQKNGHSVTQVASDKVVETPSPKQQSPLFTTVSRLAIPLTVEDNNANFSCSAQHPAIGRKSEPRFGATVRVSVLYPPGAPEIDGPTLDKPVIVGQLVNLTCRSRGGNPPGDILWLEDRQELPQRYQISEHGAEATITVTSTWSGVQSVYRCQVFSAVRPQPQEATYRLRVLYGPLSANISGAREAKGGETVELECLAGHSNPPANLSWTVDGTKLTQTEQTTNGSEWHGFTTFSSVRVQVPAGIDRDLVVTCNAVNTVAGITHRSTVTITVLRPPKQPYITGLAQHTPLSRGDIITLTCTAGGGHPPANLTWWSNDEYVTSHAVQRHLDGVSRQLTVTVSADDNGRTVTCLSSSPALVRAQKAAITLHVTFPPQSLETKVQPDIGTMTAGNQVKLICQSSAANPPANLTWVSRGQQQHQQQHEQLEGLTKVTFIKSGTSGGYSTRLVLRRTLTWQDHTKEVKCCATVGSYEPLFSSALTLAVAHAPVFGASEYRLPVLLTHSAQLSLTVHANPVAKLSVLVTRPAAGLNSSVSQQLQLLLPPPPPKQQKQQQQQRQPTAVVVVVANASRTDSGWYQLDATNEIGTGSSNLYLDVQYASKILQISKSIVVKSGHDIHLQCQIDANPIASELIEWLHYRTAQPNSQMPFVPPGRDIDTPQPSHGALVLVRRLSHWHATSGDPAGYPSGDPGVDGGGTQIWYDNGTAHLTLTGVTSHDTGYYRCSVNNTLGWDTAQTSVTVEGNVSICADQKVHQYMSLGVDDPENKVTCLACGSANATFHWSRNGVELLNSEISDGNSNYRDKYSVAIEQMGLDKQQSTLVIKTSADHSILGDYRCRVSNREAADSVLIGVAAAAIPATPTHLYSVNVSHSTVTLMWRPAFNGGRTQQFLIRFKSSGDGNYRYIEDVSGELASTTIANLQQDTKYHFWIAAKNQLGQSDFSKRPVSAHTTGTPPVGYITDREDKGHSNGSSSSSSVAAAGSSSSSSSSSANGRAEDRWSRQAPSLSQLLVIGFTAAGSVLLLINTSIAVCYVRRRRHRRHHRHHRHLPHRGSNRDRDCSHHPQHPQPEPHHQFSQLTVPPDLTSNPQQKNNMTVSHTSDAFGGIGDSGETPFIACVSTISMKTSDTFLRDDSENNLQNPSMANSSTYMVGSLVPSSFTASVSHPDRLVRSADYTCKQPQQHTLAGPVKNEDVTDCLSSIRHLSPPRLPHFLLQQPLLGSPPDLLDTMCPTGESGHHCLNDYRRDNKQLTPNRARQSLQMTSDAYDDKCASVSRRGRRSFVNRQFASLPRTSQTSLVTFARVENPATSAFTSGC